MKIDRYGDSKAKIPDDILNETPREDKRPFWVRLLGSIRASVKLKGAKPDGIEIKGGADF